MARPKGFVAWEPKPEVAVILEWVQEVLREYHDYLPMTVRQIFYRLVGAYGFEKTERAYKRLAWYIVRARRARIIPFSSIRDDGTESSYAGGTFRSPEHFMEFLKNSADAYSRPLMAPQEMRVEVWCEAGGMVPQLARVAHPYGIDVFSTGGFSSLTVNHEIASRVARSAKPTHFLHIGDFDPSGESLYEAMVEDASLLSLGLGGERINARRVALTGAQVEEHDIPTAPPKASDSRSVSWIGQTAQAEAMPPDLLAETLRVAIEEVVDLDLWRRTQREIDEERDALRAKLDEIEWGDD